MKQYFYSLGLKFKVLKFKMSCQTLISFVEHKEMLKYYITQNYSIYSSVKYNMKNLNIVTTVAKMTHTAAQCDLWTIFIHHLCKPLKRYFILHKDLNVISTTRALLKTDF